MYPVRWIFAYCLVELYATIRKVLQQAKLVMVFRSFPTLPWYPVRFHAYLPILTPNFRRRVALMQ
jgi:hypothetical protein